MLLASCSSSANLSDSSTNQSTDSTYGFTEKKPIKVGGGEGGPLSERKYLNSLIGPNGESVTFNRIGSCCFFKSSSSPMGGGLLDKFAVTYEGKKDTVVLYLNMYEKGKLLAPVGFKMK
ncbi:2-dehydro-3-deoxyphosphooctonate aldolase [Kaistella flava (ex Peng et al. 2021)]|uniref:2-dehydro-3-deoxyphosphooctonate aldolase n=1 Tax=Kaistella flava (ex Peng et al. 2021) TaxID=2038776 RepID=A0A7M2YD30_9FLAO|nr:2-dehydro-3-deoxyphosphooctonate aldolase [Kaistella flava (ex Peng et al. 2021)]